MTNTDEVLRYLRFIYPTEATNSDIVKATHMQPHQQVFQITRRLVHDGRISARQLGREWFFKAGPAAPIPAEKKAEQTNAKGKFTSANFESLARQVFSQHYDKALSPGTLPGIPKGWDLLSADGLIVGDAKYFTLVGGERLPPAKFSIIAEYVWLLEKTNARVKFLVFGNQIEVPRQWLAHYGRLLSGVDFFFLDQDGTITRLNN